MKIPLLLYFFAFNWFQQYLLLTITSPRTDDILFFNGIINKNYINNFTLQKCVEYHSIFHQAPSLLFTIILDYSNEIIPEFTLESNLTDITSYYTISKISETVYEMNIFKQCFNSNWKISTVNTTQSIYNPRDIFLQQSNKNTTHFKVTFTYAKNVITFYYAPPCSSQVTPLYWISNSFVLFLYVIILFITTIFQIDFQIFNCIHTYTKVKVWIGPIVVLILSGIILVFSKFVYIQYFISFWLVMLTGFSCMWLLNWILTEISVLDIDNTIILTMQSVLKYELFCKWNVINLTCSWSLKLVFFLWFATQSIMLSNIMIVSFAFVVISSLTIHKFKNWFWWFLSIIVYEIIWDLFGTRNYLIDLKSWFHQMIFAPIAVQIRNDKCWNCIYLSELILPGLALKVCRSFDDEKYWEKNNYYTMCFFLVISTKCFCMWWRWDKHYLIIILILILVFLGGKGVYGNEFHELWKGKKERNIEWYYERRVNENVAEKENNIELMICHSNLNSII